MRREGEGFSLLTNLARKAGAAVKRESAGADARAKRLNFERRAHKAGTSTALGFVAFQSVQNVTFKAGTAWLDPADEPVAVKEALPADPQASFS